MPHETRVRLVDTGGIRLSCRLREGGGEAVLFIHGLGADRESFEGAFAFTGLRRHTLLAPDLMGFSDSPKPDDFSYAMEDQAHVLAGLLDALGLEAVHLVGAAGL
jgi:pimeloyl-ACP methyl ester carboxylesterase